MITSMMLKFWASDAGKDDDNDADEDDDDNDVGDDDENTDHRDGNDDYNDYDDKDDNMMMATTPMVMAVEMVMVVQTTIERHPLVQTTGPHCSVRRAPQS